MTRITVPRIVLLLVALIGGFWLIEQTFRIVYRIADILLIFGLAWLLKLLLDPLMRRLRLWHVPRVLSILIAYMLFIGVFVVMVIWLTPQLAGLGQGTRQLARETAFRADQAANWLQARGIEVNPHALTVQIITLGSDFASTVAGRAFDIAQSVLSVLGKFALVITVSIYMSLTRGSMGDWLRPIIPPRWRDEYDEFLGDVKNAYSASIRGYFYVVALGTLLSSVILFGFRVPGAVLWVTLIFIMRLLPFIGGTLADGITIIAALVGLPLPLAIAAVALVTLGQVLLTNVLMPRVMSRELGINPLVVLFAVLLGARIYGVAGILFAIPAASVIATITSRAVNRYLGPLYERRGWWQEEVTVAQRHDEPAGTVFDAHRPTLDAPRPTLEEVT